jgi:hypothetical protein
MFFTLPVALLGLSSLSSAAPMERRTPEAVEWLSEPIYYTPAESMHTRMHLV